MKKIYLFKIGFLAVLLSGKLSAQTCSPQPAPSITGNTLAACTSSNSFTLTANAQSTNSVAWFANSWGGNALTTNSVYVTPTLTSGATYYAQQWTGTTSETLTMPNHASGYSGNVRGYWFTAPVSFVITGIWVPTDANTGNASVAVLKFASTPPSYASTTNSFNTLYLAQNVAGVAVMTVNIPVNAGDIIGVLGQRNGVTSYGTSPFVSTLGTNTLTITRLGMQYPLATTAPQDLWTEQGGSVGRVFLYTTLGCLSTLTPVTVTVIPNAQINISATAQKVCTGSSATLTAQGMNTYTWSNMAQSNSIVVTPNTTTSYSVAGSISSNCATVAAITISVDAAPPTITAISSQSAVCDGNTVTLSGSGNSSGTYTWTGGVSNGVPFVPAASGSYTVSANNSCGNGTAVTSIQVNPNPTITAGPVINICNGQSTTVTANGASTYTWNPGGLTGASVVVTPTTSIAFQVTGSNQFGCTAGSSQVVLVHANPTVTAGSSATMVCPGGSVTLTSNGSGGTYTWSSGGLTQNTVVFPSATSVYTVTLTNNNGCSAYATVNVSVFNPVIAISSPTTVCLGAAVTLTAGPAVSYNWSNGSGFASILVTPSVTTTYSLSALVNTGNVNCTATNSVLITVNPNPSVTASTTRTLVCRNEKGVLNASGASTYQWFTSATGSSVSVTYSNVGTFNYTVSGTDANGCSSIAGVQVKVNSCNGLDENTTVTLVVYPNPNSGDFTIRAASPIRVDVFNALGQRLDVLSLNEDNGFRATLHSVAPGVYFVCGREGNQTVMTKIVVDR
jgi:hypothetical protein